MHCLKHNTTCQHNKYYTEYCVPTFGKDNSWKGEEKKIKKKFAYICIELEMA